MGDTKYVRQTARERKDALKSPPVLVGFGKYELADLMGVDKLERISEAFVKQWPPWYRPARMCTKEDIELFQEFTAFITEVAAKSKGK